MIAIMIIPVVVFSVATMMTVFLSITNNIVLTMIMIIVVIAKAWEMFQC